MPVKAKEVSERIQKKRIAKHCIKLFIEDKERMVAEAYLYMLHDDKNKDPFCIVNEITMHYDTVIKNGLGSKLIEMIKDTAIAHKCSRLTVISESYKRGVNSLLARSGFGRHGIEFRIQI